ncbi:MAG TPA: hypothetical protein DIT32_01700 [Peptococcaceae bacterium]|nr:hypothetical protein [Peptococcaceae bacterium]
MTPCQVPSFFEAGIRESRKPFNCRRAVSTAIFVQKANQTLKRHGPMEKKDRYHLGGPTPEWYYPSEG